MAINQDDFITPITGNVVIQNNGARLVLQANTDLNTLFEGDESFKLVLRKGSDTGPVVATTAVVIVRDTSNTITYDSLVESADTIAEGGTVSITLDTTNLGPNNTLYYNTTGNAESSLFAAGNTGSFLTTGNTYTLEIATTSTIPDNETRFFQLEIREGSPSGPIKITSNVISVVDSQQAFVIATGGLLSIEDGYKIHTFTSSNTFNVVGLGLPQNRTVDYLVVAGGGGGGASAAAANQQSAAGGGAGGLRSGNIILTQPENYTVIVGAGGAQQITNGNKGNSGNASVFGDITSAGGGGGGTGTQPGANGGSGGGGGVSGLPPGQNTPAGSGNIPPTSPSQGNPGGAGSQGASTNAGGGGGGAGAAGGNGTTYVLSGIGGNGISISWVTPGYGTPGPTPGRWFAGGGAGGTAQLTTRFSGGLGGGADGGTTTLTALNGTTNTGGGGGGGGNNDRRGGAGGSGIVIVRYPYTVKTFNLTDDLFQPGAIVQGANITYALTTVNVSNNSVLYYTTSGNVTASDFFGGNTGSFTLINANASFSISIANNIVSGGDTKEFALQLREGSISGPVVASANTVTVYSQDPSNFIQATGGTLVQDGIYTLRVFTSSNDFNVSSVGVFDTVEYLIVAGGGGGIENYGGAGGGAGGAGGLLTGKIAVLAQPYLANVGAGGSAGTGAPTGGPGVAGSGGNSDIFSYLAIGGGGSAFNNTLPAQTSGRGRGGSGGGAATAPDGGETPNYGGLSISGQGFPGGSQPARNPGWQRGGGGGGASQAGSGGDNAIGGAGLAIPWIPASYGTPGPTSGRWFAGGGGAGGANAPGPTGPYTSHSGGSGGGGPGGNGKFFTVTPGTAGNSGNVNTGGGGGGAGGTVSPVPQLPGGSGGSGIVVIRYLKP